MRPKGVLAKYEKIWDSVFIFSVTFENLKVKINFAVLSTINLFFYINYSNFTFLGLILWIHNFHILWFLVDFDSWHCKASYLSPSQYKFMTGETFMLAFCSLTQTLSNWSQDRPHKPHGPDSLGRQWTWPSTFSDPDPLLPFIWYQPLTTILLLPLWLGKE